MSTFLIHSTTVQIEQGDLTCQHVDAIVNAANRHLLHGGGVAGAIVSRGGSVIQQESDDWVRLHGLVSHDHPAITGGGSLPCRNIIHTVGPVWGEGDEENKLHRAITASLFVANDLKCVSIAFPAISTGIYGFPMTLAAVCFARAISSFALQGSLHFLQIIKIILRDSRDLAIFNQAFSQLEVP